MPATPRCGAPWLPRAAERVPASRAPAGYLVDPGRRRQGAASTGRTARMVTRNSTLGPGQRSPSQACLSDPRPAACRPTRPWLRCRSGGFPRDAAAPGPRSLRVQSPSGKTKGPRPPARQPLPGPGAGRDRRRHRLQRHPPRRSDLTPNKTAKRRCRTCGTQQLAFSRCRRCGSAESAIGNPNQDRNLARPPSRWCQILDAPLPWCRPCRFHCVD